MTRDVAKDLTVIHAIPVFMCCRRNKQLKHFKCRESPTWFNMEMAKCVTFSIVVLAYDCCCESSINNKHEMLRYVGVVFPIVWPHGVDGNVNVQVVLGPLSRHCGLFLCCLSPKAQPVILSGQPQTRVFSSHHVGCPHLGNIGYMEFSTLHGHSFTTRRFDGRCK